MTGINQDSQAPLGGPGAAARESGPLRHGPQGAAQSETQAGLHQNLLADSRRARNLGRWDAPGGLLRQDQVQAVIDRLEPRLAHEVLKQQPWVDWDAAKLYPTPEELEDWDPDTQPLAEE